MNIYKQKLLLVKDSTFEYDQIVNNSIIVFDFATNILKIQNEPQELLYLLSLNTKNQIVSFVELAKGGLNMCALELCEIFKTVFLSNSNKFILIHNHPSGDPTPSKNDINFTKKIIESSKIINCNFLDHLVIGDNNFISIMNYINKGV